MPNIQEKIEEFREAMSHKNCISCICCQRAHQKFPRLAESIAQQAIQEERMRILDGLPKEANHTKGESNPSHPKDEYYGCLDCYEDSHFNTCLDQVKSLIQKDN